MRFDRLLFRNFGPYKGFQEVVFPREPGVVLVVGANMRGKTSFLNGIRFALFGSTLDRSGQPHRLIDLLNLEAVAAGEYEMRVVLDFDFRDSRYRLTRLVRPLTSERPPAADVDLKQEMHLERDGVSLSQSESDREIRRILPMSLARFFLFDGELLQQYEELLSKGASNMRAELTEAIEKILGVPVLLHARRHLGELRRMAEKDLEQAISKSKKHEKLAGEAQQLRLQIETHERDLQQVQVMVSGVNARIREIETSLSESAELVELLKMRGQLEVDLQRLSQEMIREKERRTSALTQAWKEVIARVVADRREGLEESRASLLMELGGLQQMRERSVTLHAALQSSTCPTCGRPMDGAHSHTEIEAQIAELRVDPERIGVLNQEIASINRHLKVLQAVSGSGNLRRASELEASIGGILVEISDIKRRQKRVNDSIEGRDGVEVSDLQRDLQLALESRGVSKKDEERIGRELAKARSEYNSLQSKIPADADSAPIVLARQRMQMTTHVLQLFEESVGRYRDSLRKVVEKRSTEIFLRLTSEPEYERLEINEHYGLSIIRQGGEPVTIRSAGAEHIVAFSLISALQTSSPRPGPVFIDSPFGRLDEIHTRNVIRALPEFSEQVVLLVHANEIDLDSTRNLLQSALKKELRLERRSSVYTEIVEA